jgi:INO80 complex subunit Ies4
MDPDPSSTSESRRSSRSHMSLIVRLKLPPRALAMASSTDQHLFLPTPEKSQPVASPFPPSSPPTMASSPAPGPTGLSVLKKPRGAGKRSKTGLGPGSGVFSLGNEGAAGPGAGAGGGGGSGAGTPAPATEKERAKPGPKANPGGINAGLRALDRSGKPTRRWQKVPFTVRTCSGYTFLTTTWVPPGISVF